MEEIYNVVLILKGKHVIVVPSTPDDLSNLLLLTSSGPVVNPELKLTVEEEDGQTCVCGADDIDVFIELENHE